jgi:predicted nuclease of predicted toxin-antitoxin system
MLSSNWEVLPVNEIQQNERNSDSSIWQYALKNNYVVLTFDEDFIEFQNLYGYPPKIIWLRMGNMNTQQIANRLIQLEATIIKFIYDSFSGVLEVY